MRGGKFECPQGGRRDRNVAIEFPSYQAAYDCWYSPEYQRAIPSRTPFSTGNFLIIKEHEGEQP